MLKKVLILATCLFVFPLVSIQRSKAQNYTASQTLNQIYGSIESCTQDTDADTGEHNRLAATAKYRYAVTCNNGPPGTGDGTGIACECLLGGSSVDASSAVGFPIYANMYWVFLQKEGNTHISCDPFTSNTYIVLCRLQ